MSFTIFTPFAIYPPIATITTTSIDIPNEAIMDGSINMSHNIGLVVKALREKLVKDWIPNDFVSVLSYLKVSGNNIEFVNLDKYNKYAADNDSVENRIKKANLIDQVILDSHLIKKIASHIVMKHRIKWGDLLKNPNVVKRDFQKRLCKRIEKHIKNLKK